ncbi:MAG: DUF6249 domain-containing protein [Bacteroides sp.]
MKRILIAWIIAITSCTVAFAQSQTVSSADTANDSATVLSFTDTPDDSLRVDNDADDSNQVNSFVNSLDGANMTGVLSIVTVVLVLTFGFPIFIIFIAFYFRYRNRKARYKLIEQALAAGQPLPESLFKDNHDNDTRAKGIKNICLGFGLFIFLWTMTDSFGIGAIGLLLMCIGLGEWLVAKNQPPTDEQK